MLTGPAIAGCIYFCDNGFSCSVTCDGGGMFTIPDPSAPSYQNNQSLYNEYKVEEYEYEYQSKGTVKKIYPNEYVNDLPNTEEPDIVVIDIPSSNRDYWGGDICDGSGCTNVSD
jgi:hypothetical protein